MPQTITKEAEVRYARLHGVDEENRSADFIISDGSPDRHGTAMNMQNFVLDYFRSNPIVGYQHQEIGGDLCTKESPDDVIGNSEVFFATVEGRDVLIGRVFFEPAEINEQAEKVFQKVKFGTLKAASVDILPLANEKGDIGQYGYLNEDGERVNSDIFYFAGQELVGWAVVNIPSNRNATKRSFRSQTKNAINYLKKELGNDYSYTDIDSLTVKQIREYLEEGVKPAVEDETIHYEEEEQESESEEPDIQEPNSAGIGRSRLIQIRERELELLNK